MGKFTRWLGFVFLLFVYTSILHTYYFLPKKEDSSQTPHSAPVPPVSLKILIEKNIIGLTYENYSIDHLKNELELYKKFHLSKKNPEELEKITLQCELHTLKIHSYKNIYCDLALAKKTTSPTLIPVPSPSKPTLQLIIESLEKNDPLPLLDYTNESLFKELEKVKSKEMVEKLSHFFLQNTQCFPSSIGLLLGLKNEHHLPEKDFQYSTKNIFKKTSECQKSLDNYYSDVARFRFSLYSIWEEDCSAAKNHLEILSKNPMSQFQTRSHYWQNWCAEKNGNLIHAHTLQNQLYKINPLSFHRVTIDRGISDPHREILTRQDPPVLLRSKSKPQLNKLFRLIEFALAMDEKEGLDELIYFLAKNVKKAEGGIQIYAAVLAQRNQQFLTSFKIMSSLFDEKPEMISKSTLKLSYPLPKKVLDALTKNENTLDPYLSLALIRQESGFNPLARSQVGALGLMQIMPATARTLKNGIEKNELLETEINIEIGSKYFKRLIEQFDGNVDLALASYNAGSNRINEWLKRYPVENRMLFLDLIPFGETRNYVSLIGRNYYWYLRLYSPENLNQWDTQERRPAQVYDLAPLFSQTLGIKTTPMLKQ